MKNFKSFDYVEYDTRNIIDANASAAVISSARFNSYVAESTTIVFYNFDAFINKLI